MPTGPITIQFSSGVTYILFTVIFVGSCGILVKKAWDTFFKDKKKIDDAVTRPDMEIFVEGHITDAVKGMESRCQNNRDTCLGKQWEKPVKELSDAIKEFAGQVRTDVKDIHKKMDTLIFSLIEKDKRQQGHD